MRDFDVDTEHLLKRSRAQRFKVTTEGMNLLFNYLNAAGTLKTGWIREMLKIDPDEQFVAAVNSIISLQGLRVVRVGDILNMEAISNA